ncbi:hypothetical protein ABPG75_011179 [Micractinium tetrahymenae]
MALGTAALGGAVGLAPPTRALRRSALLTSTRQSSRGRRPHRLAVSSFLALAPAPLPTGATCKAEQHQQQQQNNLLPFPHGMRNSSRAAVGSWLEQRRVPVAAAAAAPPAAVAAAGALQRQQSEAAGQPAVAASVGPTSGAAVRARRRSRLLVRAAPGAAGSAAGSGQEEGEVAQQRATGAAWPKRRRQRTTQRLNAVQEQELAAAVAAGGPEGAAAVVALVDANRPLVPHLARRFLGRGVGREDLVGEGLAALERMAAAFRPGGEARFATYAASGVWRAMQRAVHNHSRVVRLPAHQYHDMGHVKRATEELLQELGGRQPSCQAIADYCGFTLRYTAHLIRAMQGQRPATTPMAAQHGAASGTASAADLDVACEDADQEQQDQFEALRAELHSCMHALTPKQQQVVSLRWGLLDGRPRTLKEVGEQLGFTASWASVQYKAAERKLRAVMAGEAQQEPGVSSDRLASGAGAAVAAEHTRWAQAACSAVAAALPSLSTDAQLVLALRHGWMDGRKVMPSCESIAAKLHRSKSWVTAKVRDAEQQLLEQLLRLQQQGCVPQLSPPLDARRFGQLAPFSLHQRRVWQQALERVAVANAADGRWRGGSAGSGAAAAGSKAAGSQPAGGTAVPAADGSSRAAGSTPASLACSKGTGRLAGPHTPGSAARTARIAPAASAAAKGPRAQTAQTDSSHFEELDSIAAGGSATRRRVSALA